MLPETPGFNLGGIGNSKALGNDQDGLDGLKRLDLAPVPSPQAVSAGPWTVHQGRWRSSPQG